MKTYLDVINETVMFYGDDPSRRSINGDGDCLYNGPDGKQCAFARCAEEIHEWNEYEDVRSLLNEGIKLKPEYKHLTNVWFWGNIQKLHDTECFWNKDGLSEDGQLFVMELIKKYHD